MNYAIFGTGGVGRMIAAKLISTGHNVMLGTRNVEETKMRDKADGMGNPGFKDWSAQNPAVRLGTYAEAAAFGEVIFNAVSGFGVIDAFHAAGEVHVNGKIIIDISNPLDFSKGFPPSLFISNTDSLGEQLQRTFPKSKVVKTLNTLSNPLMVNPALVNGGNHSIFVSGNDAEAKSSVTAMLVSWGWKPEHVIDLGDITTARGTEAFLHLWVRLFGKFQTPMFQIQIVK